VIRFTIAVAAQKKKGSATKLSKHVFLAPPLARTGTLLGGPLIASRIDRLRCRALCSGEAAEFRACALCRVAEQVVSEPVGQAGRGIQPCHRCLIKC